MYLMTQHEDQEPLSEVVFKVSLQELLMSHKIRRGMYVPKKSLSKNSFSIKLVKENPFSEPCLIYLLFSTFYCKKSIHFRFLNLTQYPLLVQVLSKDATRLIMFPQALFPFQIS